MTRGDEITPPPDQQGPIGTWRRFGVVGPVYQILGFDHRDAEGDWMQIRVLESGEELAYKLVDVLTDPQET